ncbi:hypothetical protein ABID92_002990 [Frigoribacterium sp. PvP120]|uniref:hypothetical protein n=1 Tax=unclassified Frigoribacterium TaxID=2627005 RepID=UPI001AE72368|nr:hypothetical protein [Frigoribacterium sp. PvP121]MBP1242586.1 hypothetical protein [Frigoribacterium sp. PvP121]
MIDLPPSAAPRRPVLTGRPAGLRHASARVRARAAVTVLLATALGLALLLAGPSAPGWAAASPTPSPAPPSLGAPPTTPPPTAEPVAPTVGPVGDSATGTVLVTGTATPGARVKVSVSGSGTFRTLCDAVTAGADGAWSCSGPVPTGAGWTATARDLDQPGAPDVDSAPFSVLTPPTVRGGLLVGGKLSGTAAPGATVAVTAGGGARATATAGGDGSWTTTLPASAFPSGSYTVTATQSSPSVPDVPSSAASSAVTVRVDRDPPAAPRLTSPTAGQRIATQPVTVTGSGEAGALATVYVDSSPVCQVVVGDGPWSCSTAGSDLPLGSHVVQAALVDPAGNYGPPSAGVTVTVVAPGSAAAPPVASPTPRPGATPSPSPTAVPSPGAPSATAGPVAPASPGGDGGAPPDDPSGGAGGAPGTGDAPRGTWATATTFGEHLPTLGQTLGGPAWALAGGLALLFLLLVAAPARLAAASLRGRQRRRRASLTGRNRGVELPTSFSAATVSPWLPVALALVAGAAVTAVAAGVDDELQYARLALGIVIGLVVLNGLGVALPALLVARARGLALRVRMSPRLLLAAVVACAATRALSLDPPLVLGVLLTGALVAVPSSSGRHRGAEAAREPDSRDVGVAAAAQLGALVVLGGAAWVLHGVVPGAAAGAGAGAELARETLATVCLAGLGSLVVSLVPLGGLPGRRVWAWSRGAYVGLVVVGVSVAAVVFVGAPTAVFPLVPLVAASAVAALGAVAAWLWLRVVEPAGREA